MTCSPTWTVNVRHLYASRNILPCVTSKEMVMTGHNFHLVPPVMNLLLVFNLRKNVTNPSKILTKQWDTPVGLRQYLEYLANCDCWIKNNT